METIELAQMETIDVGIIDRNGFYIDAVLTVLEQQPDFAVVMTMTIFEDSFSGVDKADVTIVQQETNELTRGIVRQLAVEFPETKLIVLGAPDAPDVLVSYIEAGAIGYVRDSETFDQLMQVIRVVMNGGAIVHPGLVRPLCTRLAHLGRTLREMFPGDPGRVDLTPRQQEVLELLARGRSNQEIADTLSISIGTVKNHVHKIFNQLGVRSREQAATLYSNLNFGAESEAEHEG